ncbi:hypothetical protein N7495_002335 [Penicillium taxi]|uniref:uncharacterized protein n=1 Tax=Penicillium taxi TaxID=168475 RepID=UPI00254589AC|nr:uncharacterized protein N7495_002335 [Penicillium taxi]KAJ5901807.1 hypothetical protein N7495_002335 [Penicillium taxi]
MQSTSGSSRLVPDAHGLLQATDLSGLENILLAVSTGTWLIVLAVTITGVKKLGFRIWGSSATAFRPLAHIYEDQDGQATIQSSQRASKKWLRLTILSIAVVGVFLSVIRMATDSFSAKSKFVDSIEIGLWVINLAQGTALCLPSPFPTGFPIAWRMGVSNLFVLLLLLARRYIISIADHLTNSSPKLLGAQVIASSLLVIMCFMVPRRPDVYRNEKLVDRQFTTGVLSWISFSWIQPVLDKCHLPDNLTLEDLSELDYDTTPEIIHKDSQLKRGTVVDSRGIWRWILRSHHSALICQLFITVTSSFLSFAPQLALLQILRHLEDTQLETKKDELWTPVTALGLSVMASAALEPFKRWISHNKIAVRMQQQLSLAVFEKTTQIGHFDPVDEKTLLSSEVKTITDFFCLAFTLCESPIKIGISSIFLAHLLGWKSMLAGIAVLTTLAATRSIVMRRYSGNQKKLMRLRDSRLEMMTEILQGVCPKRIDINELRDYELKSQWSVYFWQIGMSSMSSISPILLSIACIAAYAWSHGSLSASTAFTSISVLNSLQAALAVLPNAITSLFDASNSVERLTLFFSQAEKLNNTIPSDTVKFRNASISWPGAGPGSSYTLTGLELRFPKDTVSIITGPPGSGKSLLLSAMLDEVKIISGLISAPVSAPLDHTLSLSDPDTWLSTVSLAYVSQKPWLQNATIQENIRLGLPLDHRRYAKVIFVCGLEHDLKCLPQGDQTVLSCKGANISDSQKSRISLARALYSRAKTLVVDDIFTTIDKEAATHIYRHVLCGDVLNERTFILATRNVELCLPQAEYLVTLENGRLKSAVSIRKMAQPGFDHSSLPEEENHSALKSAKSLVSTGGRSQHNKPTISESLHVLLRQGGDPTHWMFFGVAFIGYAAVMLGRAWCIRNWTQPQSEAQSSEQKVDSSDYLTVYAILSASACLLMICRKYLSMVSALRVSERIFHHFVVTVLRAPEQWHDNASDMINRFSADLNVLDSRLGEDLDSALGLPMDVGISMLAGVIVSPVLAAVAALLLVVYLWCGKKFSNTSRQLKQLEKKTESSVIDHFDACQSGLSTIRAYGKIDKSLLEFQDRVGRHARAYWNLHLLNRWLDFRVNMLGAIFSALTVSFIAHSPDVSASTAGFAISFTLEVSLLMALSIRSYSRLEGDMESLACVDSISNTTKLSLSDETSFMMNDISPRSSFNSHRS